MKNLRLKKTASAVLAALVLLGSLTVGVSARSSASGTIEFTGSDGTELSSAYNKYLRVLYDKNMWIQDNSAVVYATRKTDGEPGMTMNFTVDAGELMTTFDDGGVITYSFKYKWEASKGTPGDVRIKLGHSGDGNKEVDKVYSKDGGTGYIPVASLSYDDGLYACYNGRTKTSGDRWTAAQTAWTNGFCEVTVKVDLYGKRLGLCEGSGEWFWMPIDTSAHSLSDFWQLGLRGALGKSDGTVDSNFWVDDISVSYTTEPAALDTGVLEFDGDNPPAAVTATWKSGEISTCTESVAGRSGVLEVKSDTTANAAVSFANANWCGSDCNGKITYELDVYTNEHNVYFTTGSANNEERLGVLTDTYLMLWNNGESSVGTYKSDVKPTEWQHVKLELDRSSRTAAVSLNGKLQGTALYTQSGKNDFTLVVKGTNPKNVAPSKIYIDNLRASYNDEAPTLTNVSHSWTDGIKATFSTDMSEATLTGGGLRLTDTYTNSDVDVSVSYDSDTKTATLVPSGTLYPSRTYTLGVSDSVKSSDGIYIKDAVSRVIDLEALNITENEISYTEENKTVWLDEPHTISYTAESAGRYRLRASLATGSGSGVRARVLKNDDTVWTQYIPKSEDGIVDVRMQCAANDALKLVLTPDGGQSAVAVYSLLIKSYEGSLAINETSGGQGDSLENVTAATLMDYITSPNIYGTELYAVFNGKRFDMTKSGDKWSVNVLKDLDTTLTSTPTIDVGGKKAILGGLGGSPTVTIPIKQDGLLHISGKISGIYEWLTQNGFTYDDEGQIISEGYYSRNYAGVCTNISLNDEQVWSSRVGESAVRYDELYDTSYFREAVDCLVRVKAGDELTFSFDPWRKAYQTYSNVPFSADLGNVQLSYVKGTPISEALEARLEGSTVFDLYAKEVTQGGATAAADIVLDDGTAYLEENEAQAIFGSDVTADTLNRGEKTYLALTQAIEDAGLCAVSTDGGLVIAHDGISGQYSYSEISRLNAVYGTAEVLAEDGSDIDFSALPQRVRVFAQLSEAQTADKGATLYLAGFKDGVLEYVSRGVLELKSGDEAVSRVITLDDGLTLDEFRVYVWTDDMVPLT